MPAEPFPYGISPDPRYLLLVAIATPEQIEEFKRAIQACGYAKRYEWSSAQPVADVPSKVMIALNRAVP
jgi:hypothetical protein